MTKGEKRSRDPTPATLAGPGQAPPGRSQGWGVGGPPLPAPQGGGGYLDECTARKFAPARVTPSVADPRLGELAAMDMPPYWLNVAAAIGVDAFLTMWRLLDSEQALWRDVPGGGLLVPLRRYRSYLRFQRNRYVEELNAMGLTVEQIREQVSKNIGEQLSKRHLKRLRGAG